MLERDGIVVVVLEDTVYDDNFHTFLQKSAIEKISIIEKQIRKVCTHLAISHPEKQWIFGLREYAISNGSPLHPTVVNADEKINTRAATVHDEEIMKTTFSQLTLEFPNLAIIAGTIAPTSEPLKDLSILTEIKSAYRDPLVNFIRDAELASSRGAIGHLATIDNEVLKHEAEIDAVIKKMEKGEISHFRTQEDICYLFYRGLHGEPIIERHGKIAPVNETVLPNIVFKPGTNESAKPFFVMESTVLKKKLILGAEICREHDFRLLQHTLNDEADVHFVISDTVKIQLAHKQGKFIIPIDSNARSRVIYTQPQSKPNVVLYINSVNDDKAQLYGPTEPLYPCELRFIDELDRLIKMTDGPTAQVLKEIKATFIENSKNFDLSLILDPLKENLLLLIETLQQEAQKKSFFSGLLGKTIFRTKEKVSPSFISELISFSQQIEEEQNYYAPFKDICSFKEPPLQKVERATLRLKMG